jgi:Family of unknown function (DUF6282)
VVTDDDGRLRPEAAEIVALVIEFDAVLATGHVSRDEHFAAAAAVSGRGKLLVTHAREELAGPNLSVEDCVALAGLGAVIELCAMTCLGPMATRSAAEVAATVRATGAERCTLATDYGQKVNARPAAGLQAFADALEAEGIDHARIRRMACANPCQLLGL